jgi:thiol-disulfide isomerase/thioredoxin
MYINLNDDNLLDVLDKHEKTFVMFGASWCNNCKNLKPKFYKKAFEQNDIPFIYVDCDMYPNSRSLGLIGRIPKLVGYRGYKIISQKEGSSDETLNEVYNQLINS